MKLPVDLMFGHPEEPHQRASDYAHALLESSQLAREHLETMTNRMKQKHDLQMEPPSLQGDIAWLHNRQRRKGVTPKLNDHGMARTIRHHKENQ